MPTSVMHRVLHCPMLLIALSLGVLVLSGCAGGTTGDDKADEAPISAPTPSGMMPPVNDANGRPLIEQPLSSAPVPVADTGVPGEVDVSCSTDADCVVKNVGNCCGYYPACVNIDSPTFPEQVMAECAKNDMMAVCGFADIQGCQCVEGRCASIDAGAGPVR